MSSEHGCQATLQQREFSDDCQNLVQTCAGLACTSDFVQFGVVIASYLSEVVDNVSFSQTDSFEETVPLYILPIGNLLESYQLCVDEFLVRPGSIEGVSSIDQLIHPRFSSRIPKLSPSMRSLTNRLPENQAGSFLNLVFSNMCLKTYISLHRLSQRYSIPLEHVVHYPTFLSVYPWLLRMIPEELRCELRNWKLNPIDRVSGRLELENLTVVDIEQAIHISSVNCISNIAKAMENFDSDAMQASIEGIEAERNFFENDVIYSLPESNFYVFDNMFNYESLVHDMKRFNGRILWDEVNTSIVAFTDNSIIQHLAIVYPHFCLSEFSKYATVSDVEEFRSGPLRYTLKRRGQWRESRRSKSRQAELATLGGIFRKMKAGQLEERIRDNSLAASILVYGKAVELLAEPVADGLFIFEVHDLLSAANMSDATRAAIAVGAYRYFKQHFWDY